MATAFQIRHAASVIKRGGIITYPTDTIYGLGCDPFNQRAVESLSRLKHRPAGKSMILLASDSSQLRGIIDESVPADFDWQTQSPTSWIMPAHPDCPYWLSSRDDNSVAVRLTQHRVVTALCEHINSPIVSTSANLSGMPPACDSLSIHRIFRGRVHAMLFSDETTSGKASTIKHFSDQSIVRS